MFIRSGLLRVKQIAPGGNTNCDIFSCVSSQLAVWAWNIAAIAAASSSLVMLLDITGCFQILSGRVGRQGDRKRTGVELLFICIGVSSLPSNRFDIAPLCHVAPDELPDR